MAEIFYILFDGSEIRRSPVEVGSLSHDFLRVLGPFTRCFSRRISEPSTVPPRSWGEAVGPLVSKSTFRKVILFLGF